MNQAQRKVPPHRGHGKHSVAEQRSTPSRRFGAGKDRNNAIQEFRAEVDKGIRAQRISAVLALLASVSEEDAPSVYLASQLVEVLRLRIQCASPQRVEDSALSLVRRIASHLRQMNPLGPDTQSLLAAAREVPRNLFADAILGVFAKA